MQFKSSDNSLLYQNLPPFVALTQAKPWSNDYGTIHNTQTRQTHCTPEGQWLNAKWQEKTKVFGAKYVAVSFCPKQIPRGLPWEVRKCNSNIQISLTNNSWHWSVEINLYHPPQPHAGL